MPDEKYRVLKNALVYLADLDRDYAQAENAVGFSQAHTGLGHKLADDKPFEAWSPWDLFNAYKICTRYKNTQLGAFDIDGVEPPPKPEPKPLADKRFDIPESEQIRTIAVSRTPEGKWLFIIRFDFSWEIKDTVKQNVPGAKFVSIPNDKHWEAPVTPDTTEGVLKLGIDFGFDLDGVIIDLAERLAVKQAEVIKQSRARTSDFKVEGLGLDLYQFQVAGVELANQFIETGHAERKRGGVAIFDDPGLGKTPQGLALAKARDAFPLLVICPASIKVNWLREVRRWLPGKTVEYLVGREPGRYDRDVTIINYDILEKHREFLFGREFPMMLIDEAHYCKGYKSKRTKFVQELAKSSLPVELTGTPILNRPSELWPLIQIAGRGHHYGGFWRYMEYYCGAIKGRYGLEFRNDPEWTQTIQPKRLAELAAKSRATWVVRRDTHDKQELLGLPPKRRNLVYVELSSREKYDKASADTIAYCGERAAEDKAFLASIAHLPPDEREYLKKERAQSAEFRAAQAEQLTRVNALRQLIFELKWPSIQEWLTNNFVDTGRPGVIFAYHREAVEQIAEFLKAPKIMGGMTAEAKQASVDAFMDGDAQFIVGNILAMGLGLTLTKAEDTVFCELAWRPADISQGEDRVYRIGQKSQTVSAHYLLGEGTIDTDMGEMLDRKLRVVTAGTDSDQELEGGSVLGAVLASFREGQKITRVAA